MSTYMTEQEQLEMIKKWWQKYGNLILTIASIVMLVAAGLQYWNWHERKILDQSSTIYENMMIAFANQEEDKTQAFANTLVQNYSKTVYSAAAHLTLAKYYVNQENYEKAIAELQAVVKHAKTTSLKELASIRLARIWISKKDYEKALSELNTLHNSPYMPIVAELKGDIYTATGKYQEAVQAYHDAIAFVSKAGMGNLFLEMKTNEAAAHVSTRQIGLVQSRTV